MNIKETPLKAEFCKGKRCCWVKLWGGGGGGVRNFSGDYWQGPPPIDRPTLAPSAMVDTPSWMLPYPLG